MRRIGILCVVVLLAVLAVGFASIFSSPPTAETVKQKAKDMKDKVFSAAGVPDSKAGELYHQGAAKMDRLSGEMSARKHEALVTAKKINDNVGEAYDYVEPKVEGAFEKVKEWTGLAGEKVKEAKDYAYDQAGVPKTKIGELYHQGAAKVDQALGNDLDARRHEALVAAKRINDDPTDIMNNVQPLANGVLGKVQEWAGKAEGKAYEAKDRAIDAKDRAYNAAGVPKTKVGELYHQGAAKVDQALGYDLDARRHEALVTAKRINDDPTDVMHNVEPLAKGVFGKLKEWTGLAHEKARETGENVKEYADDALDRSQDAFETAKERAQSAKYYASSKYHEAKGNAKGALHNAKDTLRDTAEQIVESSEDGFDTVGDRTNHARDFASEKYYQNKAHGGDAYHNAKEYMRESADDLDARSQAARDSASAKYYQNKGTSRNVYHNGNDYMRDTTNEVYESSPKGKLHAIKDFITSKYREAKGNMTDRGYHAHHPHTIHHHTHAHDHVEQKSKSHILGIVILSLLSGGLLYLFFGHGEQAHKARGKLNEAKGNAAELYHAGKIRAREIAEKAHDGKVRELSQTISSGYDKFKMDIKHGGLPAEKDMNNEDLRTRRQENIQGEKDLNKDDFRVPKNTGFNAEKPINRIY